MPTVFLSKEVIETIGLNEIRLIMEKHKDTRYDTMQGQYEGKHSILSHTQSDESLPNNRVVCNFCKYITDVATGYFLGNAVAYGSENEAFLQIVQEIFEYNDEQDENFEMSKKASIHGNCYEMLYVDEDTKIRMGIVNPNTLWYLCENEKTEPLAVIRKIETEDLAGKKTLSVEHWNAETVVRYAGTTTSDLKFVDETEHFWSDVPFLEIQNNAERIGDFSGIITQNDAYNRSQSNTANLFQYNDQAILTIKGIGEIQNSEVKQMKEDGAIVLDEQGALDWLTKDVNDTALENFKTRLSDDIHAFSYVPNLSDEQFGGNVSGIAMAYKLWGLEQLRGMKERKFKRGLQRRLELIANMLKFQSRGDFNYLDINMTFRTNMPENTTEWASIVSDLVGMVSQETLLSNLPFIEDASKELAKIEAERKSQLENEETFGGYGSVLSGLEELEAGEVSDDQS